MLLLALALAAYSGGFLPGHFSRRIDRVILHANSRDEGSRWREVIEGVTLSLSDQQLVTGIAILIAGYSEMLRNDLDVYHWQMIVYLAWLSSSVHIASLTLLKDVLNEHPQPRNLRVAAMLVLLVLLFVAMWPLRKQSPGDNKDMSMPVRCLLGQSALKDRHERIQGLALDLDWVFSIVTLLGAYLCKLS